MDGTAASTLDNEFWKFSLAVYAAPGVADECLALQENLGIDVNVLLFCAWLASARKVALTPHDIAELDTVVRDWHAHAVKPLRGVRRYMKTISGGEVALLRTRVKGVELEAERIEQAMLFAHAETHWPRAGQGTQPAALWSNLETYLRTQGYCGPGGDALPLRALCAAVPTVGDFGA